ncbi:MAG: MFS transporter [Arenicellales bacterium]
MTASSHGDGVSHSRAWAAFVLGTVYFGYAFAQRVAPSVMTVELMRDLSVGGAALGTLSACYFYGYAGLQLPVGVLIDHFGPRKLLSASLALCAIASAGFAFSHSMLPAAVTRTLIGATVAFSFVGALAIAGYWFPHGRFATLSGALMTVGMIGSIAGQAPLRVLVEHIGWRDSMVVLAIVAALLGILLFAAVPNRRRHRAAGVVDRHPLAGLMSAARNPQTWLCAAIGFAPSSTLLAFSGLWAVPWLSTVHGLPVAESAAIASVVSLGWAVGAPLMGWASDRMGRRKPVILVGMSLSLAALCLIIFTGIASTLVLCGLFFLSGFGGSTMVLSYVAVRELNPSDSTATALGMMNTVVVASGAILQPLIGWILDLNWSGGMIEGARVYGADTYAIAFTTLVATNVLGLACLFWLRETWCKPMEERLAPA